MSESLSLAARLAANLFVDAINLAKPAGRLAGKIGDRLLGGSPFNEREAQRFLTMGGSERLDRAEEANEVLDPFWADGGPTEWLPGYAQCGAGHRYWDHFRCTKPAGHDNEHGYAGSFWHDAEATDSSNPAGAADPKPSIGGVQDAPGVQPPVEQAPGPAQTSPSCAGPGATSMPQALQQLDDLLAMRHQGLRGMTIEPRSEHPMYAEIQDVADAAVVADVLSKHEIYFGWTGCVYCTCDPEPEFGSAAAWRAHVAPLIIAELQK